MKKYLVYGINLIICILSFNYVFGEIREPAVAGTFYPIDSTELKETVDKFLKEAGNKKLKGIKPVSIIVPHAGYIYSGATSAFAYKELEGYNYDVVFIIGPSHYKFVDGASIYSKGKFKTPLGFVNIDEKSASDLMKLNKKFIFDKDSHIKEHSIEVQIPFLQRVLKNFIPQSGTEYRGKIVPITINDGDFGNCESIANSIFKVAKYKNVLIIASSDLSHYPKYDDALKVDKAITDAIESFDVKNLEKIDRLWMNKNIQNLSCTLCGDAAVKVTMLVSSLLGANKGKIMKLTNSGDIAVYGDKGRVVGYTAIVFWQDKDEEDLLTKTEGKKLIELSRQTLTGYILKGEIPKVYFKEVKLNEKRGVFVTLRKKGILRGCIGYIEPRETLVEAVKKMTIASATEDPRFPPVAERKELNDIKIEISVLSKLKRAESIDDIVLGKHGVIVKRGFNSGVFLPQVALETGWSKEEFLNHLVEDKAGLPKNSWKDKETEIYIFTVQIFEEH